MPELPVMPEEELEMEAPAMDSDLNSLLDELSELVPSAEAEIAVPDITVLIFLMSPEVAEEPKLEPKSLAAEEVKTDAVRTQTPAW